MPKILWISVLVVSGLIGTVVGALGGSIVCFAALMQFGVVASHGNTISNAWLDVILVSAAILGAAIGSVGGWFAARSLRDAWPSSR